MTFVRDTLLHEISCLLANWFRRTRPYFFVPFCLNLLESRTGGFQRLLQVPWGYFPSSAKAQREYEVIDPNGSQPLQQGSNTPLGVCKPEEAESSRRRFTDPCCYVTALFLRGFGRSPIPSTHSFTSACGRGQLSSMQSGAGAFSCWGILHLSLSVSQCVVENNPRWLHTPRGRPTAQRSTSQGPLGRGVCRPVSPGATQPYFGFESS